MSYKAATEFRIGSLEHLGANYVYSQVQEGVDEYGLPDMTNDVGVLVRGGPDKHRPQIAETIKRALNLVYAPDAGDGGPEIDGLAHELWAVAQCMPGEGILDAVSRIKAVLDEYLRGETDED